MFNAALNNTNISSEIALTVRGLKKSYGKFTAVNGIDFSIASGKCLALLGPNGAGKTTTCEILEGLVEADAGEVEIFGQSLAKNRKNLLELIGVQLQETVLYQKYTVRETLQLFASFYKKNLNIDTIIQQLGLGEKSKVRLEKLSGGQRQRVHLGCALVNDPRLLFLDEPTTGLDPQARRNIWDLIEQLKKDGRSILLTTHYMDEAEKLADDVAIMHLGKIIAYAPPYKLIEQYCGSQVLSFSLNLSHDDSEPNEKSEENFAKLAKEVDWLSSAIKTGSSYSVSYPGAGTTSLQMLLDAAKRLSISIDRISLRNATLEDVFLKLTGRSFQNV
ncbi:MAG: ABC transporter ATP-binding protein [Oligoflexales bacterium]|nr:ABC transporter ATP-binding protein [Oligoflexales bacterium]